MEISNSSNPFPELIKNYRDLDKKINNVIKLERNLDENFLKLQSTLSALRNLCNGLIASPEVKEWLVQWLDQRTNELKVYEDGHLKQYGFGLEHALAEIKLGLSGHMPQLKTGYFTIEVIPRQWQAKLWLGPRQEELGICPLVAQETVKKIQEIRSKLGTRLGESEYLNKLSQCISKLQSSNSTDGYVPIIDVLWELAPMLQSAKFKCNPKKEFYTSYSRADFSVDLLHFSKHIQLRTAARAFTKQRSQFLWVPSDELSGEGTVYSHIRIRKELDE